MASAQPVWSRVDEAQHADYVAHLARGEWPVEGRTRITAATLAVMERTSTYRWQLPGREPDPPERSVSDFTAPPPVHGEARRTWFARHLWTYSYEAAQPPLFYLLAVPAWWFGEAAGGPLGAVYAVRLFDALLVALLAPLAAAASLLVTPSRGRALASAAVAGLVPGMLLNGTAITNDTLAAVLGGGLVVTALAGVRRGWSTRLAVLAGALLGAAVLAKLTAAALVVGLGVAFLWPWLARRAGLIEALRPGVLAAFTAVALVAPWIAVNLVIYHHPGATAEADRLLGSVFGPPHVTLREVAASFKNGFATFWSGEPWETLPINRPLTALGLAWTLLSAVGVQRMIRAPGSRAAMTVVFSIAVGTGVWAFTAMLLSHIGGFMPGRYAYPALVAVAVVLVHGGAAALSGGRLRVLAAAGLAAYIAVAGLDVAGFAAGFTGAARPSPVAAPGSGAGTSLDVRATMGPVVLTADQVVREPAGRRVLVHLRVANQAATEMHWWPVAVVIGPEGREQPLTSNYAEGTQMPEVLPAGGSAEGWVVFDTVPDALLASGLKVGFLGVAVDGYRTYGDLVVEVPTVA